jgi:integrase
MPANRVRLTNTFADSAPSGPRGTVYWDTEIPGFGLAVHASGHRAYVFKYRIVGGRRGHQRKPTIGAHGPMTCQQARDIARNWHAKVRAGGDPSGDRKEMRDSPTVSELCDRYLEQHARPKKKPKSVQGDESAIRRLIKPALGAMKVSAVRRSDIEEFHRSLRGTPPMANRLVALLSKMFNLAERWGCRDGHSNPCRGIEKYREHSRERFLTAQEISRLDDVLTRHESSNPWMTNLIRLLILTGARRGELETLRWAHVELDPGRLRLPDSKTGAKVIVLSAKAVSILRTLPKVKDNCFVFPGKKMGKHVNGLSKFWQRVRSESGLHNVRLHDLRHSFASQAVLNGASLPMIGALLGHRSTATTARYAHLADNSLRNVANAVADSLFCIDPVETERQQSGATFRDCPLTKDPPSS